MIEILSIIACTILLLFELCVPVYIFDIADKVTAVTG